MKQTYLSSWYWRVKQRRGAKKALIALSRKILTIIYSILKNADGSYQEDQYAILIQRHAKHRQEKMIKELALSGFVISPPEKIA
jgi:hypothetical protein